MGLLRYCLAALVLISHLGITVGGYNPGVVAVAVFYLLAGHVVQRLLDHIARSNRQSIREFLVDRLWRILPGYFSVLALALLVWAAGANSPFLSTTPGLSDWFANLTVVPLNYYMYNGQDSFTLIPPAWSLGTELQFYLLAPLLWWLPLRGWWVLFATSLVVYGAAQLQWLNLDYFGYRLLPGVGFIFMLGMLLQRIMVGTASRNERWLAVALWSVLTLYSLALVLAGLHRPWDREVALGLALGLPAVILVARWQRRGVWRRLDSLAGALAYGIFIAHFPVFWAWRLLTDVPVSPWTALVLSSLVAALVHYAVERPLWHRFRKRL